jgi:hypothetical protein
MNLEDIMLSEVNQSQKDKYQESTYMSYAEKSNSETKKQSGGCQGLGEWRNEESMYNDLFQYGSLGKYCQVSELHNSCTM